MICSITFLTLGCTDEQPPEAKTPNLDTKFYREFQRLQYYETLTIDPERIQPYRENPRYWQYKGEPILLLGASDDDNLFNHPDIWPFGLASHLDLMVRNGGNYVRNTMSSRDYGNVWPFKKNETGRYDLTMWNDEYWRRFDRFLRMTYERDIVVQIELWDRFDFAREPWDSNPFNPRNNINYTSAESGLSESIRTHPNKNENAFFKTPPDFEGNQLLLEYQQGLIDKVLSISFAYPHVLYCVSNETSESTMWSDYWAYFILKRAKEAGVQVYVTEMWDAWDLLDPAHDATFKRPDLYAYVELSQNSHQVGQVQWDNAQRVRTEKLGDRPRPMNSVKIYGGTRHGGGFEEGARKLWRNVFGGFASSRFHRMANPFGTAGIGLSVLAQQHIRSMRKVTEKINVFESEPANHLLIERESDEAFAMANPPDQYAVYFPDGGSVRLDLSDSSIDLSVEWLNIASGRWEVAGSQEGAGEVVLSPPGNGPWAAILRNTPASPKAE